MKEKKIEMSVLLEIKYKIGENEKENEKVIDEGEEEDLWFHNGKESSCHVLCKMPKEKIAREMRKRIIRKGAELCKYHTKKTRHEHLTEIIYTKINNVKKTNIPGRVIAENVKRIHV